MAHPYAPLFDMPRNHPGQLLFVTLNSILTFRKSNFLPQGIRGGKIVRPWKGIHHGERQPSREVEPRMCGGKAQPPQTLRLSHIPKVQPLSEIPCALLKLYPSFCQLFHQTPAEDDPSTSIGMPPPLPLEAAAVGGIFNAGDGLLAGKVWGARAPLCFRAVTWEACRDDN